MDDFDGLSPKGEAQADGSTPLLSPIELAPVSDDTRPRRRRRREFTDGPDSPRTQNQAGQQEQSRPSVSWSLLPAEAWQQIADLLPDQELVRSASTTRCLVEILESTELWVRRADAEFASLPFSELEREEMKREVRLEGRHGYVCRRVLFKGLRVALLMGKPEMGPLVHLARWCGAKVQQSGQGADILLIGPGGGSCAAFATSRHSHKLYRGAWLRASCVAGRQLPRHRIGCASIGASFSSFRSCIAGCLGSSNETPGAFGCYAPRLMEGLLLSTSRLRTRSKEAVVMTAQLLGAQCTDELTKAHTHLIAGASQGEKYEFAKQNRIPIVSVAWVDNTLRLGMPMKERCFPVSGAED
ncbi:rsmF [Symbiodinium sp. KB8]|nr:rsmF [Symbiodinium sp. KB8]